LRAWRDAHAPALGIVAVTVDHGLRPEAGDEAQAVAAICTRLDLAHETRRWTDTKPATGLAEAARLARYGLLAEAAAAHGTDVVLTGHTMDDQAETVAMREKRGEGRGLAGMAAATLHRDRTWILRPLLRQRREALREVLRDAGIGWIDDPSNERETSERVRVRRMLAAEPGAVERLAQAAAEAGRQRRDDAVAAARWLERAEPAGEGVVRLPRDAFDEGSLLLPMRALLAAIGGTPHLPGEDATAALIARLGAGESGTLSRTLVKRRREGFILSREVRGASVSATAVAEVSPPPLTHPHKGEGGVNVSESPYPLWGGVRGGGRPGETTADSSAPPACVVAPWETFLPGFDIALRNAVARLLGTAAVPLSPAG
jgi:tRNA(Ile)-lysidine synthase